MTHKRIGLVDYRHRSVHTGFAGGGADAHQRMQPQLHRLQFARRGRRVVEYRIDLRVDAHETRQDRRELAVQIQQTLKHNDATVTAQSDDWSGRRSKPNRRVCKERSICRR